MTQKHITLKVTIRRVAKVSMMLWYCSMLSSQNIMYERAQIVVAITKVGTGPGDAKWHFWFVREAFRPCEYCYMSFNPSIKMLQTLSVLVIKLSKVLLCVCVQASLCMQTLVWKEVKVRYAPHTIVSEVIHNRHLIIQNLCIPVQAFTGKCWQMTWNQ